MRQLGAHASIVARGDIIQGRCYVESVTNPSYTRLLEGCTYSTKFRTSRHNNTFKLLHDLLETHNGGRWPIISMYLRSKPVRDFKTQTHIETTTTKDDKFLQTIEAIQEGLQNDKAKTNQPTIIPNTRLPKHKRPKQKIPDIIRAIGCRRNSQGLLVEDTTYRGIRCLQLTQ